MTGAVGIPAFSFLLAWRQLVTRSVTIFGTVGVAVSVWAMIFVISVLSGFVGQWHVLLSGATPQLLITDLPDGTGFSAVTALLDDEPDIAGLAPRMVHQAVVRPRGVSAVRIRSTSGLQAQPLEHDFIELVGVDPELEAETTPFRQWLEQPILRSTRVVDPSNPFVVPADVQHRAAVDVYDLVDPEADLFDRRGVILGERRIDRRRVRRGQEVELFSVRLAAARDTPPVGTRAEEGGDGGTSRLREIRRILPVAGGFRTRHAPVDQTRAFVHIDDLREMLGWDIDFGDPWDPVHEVAVRLTDDADLDATAARLQARCREAFGSARARTWRDVNEVFLSAVEQERANIKLAMLATLPVAAFLIYATLTMLVMQKRRDIGILLALGASPRGILATFLLGGSAIAVVGSGAGAALGCMSTIYLNDLDAWARRNFGIEIFPSTIYGPQEIPVDLQVDWVVQVVVGAFLIAMLAVTLPAVRASRMEPVQTLAHE